MDQRDHAQVAFGEVVVEAPFGVIEESEQVEPLVDLPPVS
jgi:hypothetical protein